MNLQDLIRRLKAQAKRSTWSDSEDFNPCEMSGGNYDDAYSGGYQDGRTELAREIVEEFFSENDT